jgi:hypothetical protein
MVLCCKTGAYLASWTVHVHHCSMWMHSWLFSPLNNILWVKSQSQSYITTGGIPPVSTSWRQAPWDSQPVFFFNWTFAVVVLMLHPLWQEDGSFTIAAGLHQRSHSRIQVSRISRPYFSVSDSRLLHPGRPSHCIYIPQEQGGPVIPPGTGFPFRRLLQLLGLQWRYSNPPPHGVFMSLNTSTRYIAQARTAREISFIIACSLVAGETAFPQSCSLATAVALSHVYTAVTRQWVYMSLYNKSTLFFSIQIL